jgi:hypothetical protein
MATCGDAGTPPPYTRDRMHNPNERKIEACKQNSTVDIEEINKETIQASEWMNRPVSPKPQSVSTYTRLRQRASGTRHTAAPGRPRQLMKAKGATCGMPLSNTKFISRRAAHQIAHPSSSSSSSTIAFCCLNALALPTPTPRRPAFPPVAARPSPAASSGSGDTRPTA